jgi:hypothetical protein
MKQLIVGVKMDSTGPPYSWTREEEIVKEVSTPLRKLVGGG